MRHRLQHGCKKKRTTSTFSELYGALDVGAPAQMLAGTHENDIQQEQCLRCVWLHEMQFHDCTIDDGIVKVCMLVDPVS